jgi:hypothetical protein
VSSDAKAGYFGWGFSAAAFAFLAVRLPQALIPNRQVTPRKVTRRLLLGEGTLFVLLAVAGNQSREHNLAKTSITQLQVGTISTNLEARLY